MKMQTNKLSLEELEPCLNDLVGVLMSDINDSWFSRQWNVLENANMTTYANDIQKTLVYINALVLGVLWREFNHVLYEEGNEIELSYLVESIPFSELRLGQIIGPDFEKELNTDDEDEKILLRNSILIELISDLRSPVIIALKRHYGDDLSFFQGFTSFKAPVNNGVNDNVVSESEEMDDLQKIEDLDQDDEQNEDLDGGFQEAAFLWISEGCPEIANIV